ncbi:MAG: hypothetical protein GXY81_00735 [Candidatus Cloacimonetes bacterium]|nr:hypothetical protein [Candidatus Cloacimonadota bacterium]
MEHRLQPVVGARFIWHMKQIHHPLPPDKSGVSDRLETGIPAGAVSLGFGVFFLVVGR